MPKGGGKKRGKITSFGGRVTKLGRKLSSFVRHLGGIFGIGRGKRPKGMGGRGTGSGYRRNIKPGGAGR